MQIKGRAPSCLLQLKYVPRRIRQANPPSHRNHKDPTHTNNTRIATDMACHEANMARLHEMQVLVQPGAARREGITIPAHYEPESISPDLASGLVRLAIEMQLRNIPLEKLWAHHDGVLEPLMHSQHAFSGINSRHLRIQIVNHAITQVTNLGPPTNMAEDGNGAICVSNLKFWGFVGLEIGLSTMYAVLRR